MSRQPPSDGGRGFHSVREWVRDKTLDRSLRYVHRAPDRKQGTLAKIAAVFAKRPEPTTNALDQPFTGEEKGLPA